MIHWDPKPEIFTLPIIHWPILWYGVLFTFGFAVGFPLFVSILFRYFLNRPDYGESDILHPEELPKWGRAKSAIAHALNLSIAKEEMSGVTPEMKQQVLKSRCLHPERAMVRLRLDHQFGSAVLSLRKKALTLTDRLTVYMVVATILGARIGHFLFYERPSTYFNDPTEIFRVWEGGLASHGAIVAIILALIFFAHRIRDKAEGLTWLRLLDFVSLPTAFVGACIRVGNFFNQEILGTPSNLPWAVVFGHPADYSLPIPRHPVQLYEAVFYLAVFFLLWALSYRPRFLLAKGKLIGLFLMLVFGFRFLIEFLKVEQSHLLSHTFPLTMGQLLSIPAFCLGAIFYFWRRRTA